MRACKGTIEEITYLRQVYKMGLTSSAIDGVWGGVGAVELVSV